MRRLGPAGGDGGPEYSQGLAVAGDKTLLFLAGQVAVDDRGQLVGEADVALQANQVLRNIGGLLSEAGGGYEDIVSFTTYLTAPEHIPAFVTFRHETFPLLFPDGGYPVNTLVIVSGLAKAEFLIEIAAVAAISAGGDQQ